MATLKTRLQSLEVQLGLHAGMLRDFVTLLPGQSPLHALEGRPAGLYFLIDAGLSGPGMLGKVSASGKRAIIYGGLEP